MKPVKKPDAASKAAAPGQRQKAGEGTAKSFAPGQIKKAANAKKKGK